MTVSAWSVETMAAQNGRVMIVTGASGGIGQETARVLAASGATVVLAVRDIAKGGRAAEQIRARHPRGDLRVHELDLANLASVERFAAGIRSEFERLDVLIDNAGVMMCPYALTADGFEMQFGTNHLGHFALTLRLLPLLVRTAGSRVVVVGSLSHKHARLDLTDPHWKSRPYNTGRAYSDSKLANLLFARALARRLGGQGGNPLVVAAHPGVTASELERHSRYMAVLNRLIAQPVEAGAWPILRAAVDPGAAAGDYFGPARWMEMRGEAVRVQPSAQACDDELAERLWRVSAQMTGVS